MNAQVWLVPMDSVVRHNRHTDALGSSTDPLFSLDVSYPRAASFRDGTMQLQCPLAGNRLGASAFGNHDSNSREGWAHLTMARCLCRTTEGYRVTGDVSS